MRKLLKYAVASLILCVTSCNDDDNNDEQSQNENPKTVDLGLPSGRLWANVNLGATSESETGLYFAWGETVGYTSDLNDGRIFWYDTYKFYEAPSVVLSNIPNYVKYTFADGLDGSDEKHPRGYWYDDEGNFIGDNINTLEDKDDAAQVILGNGWKMPSVEDVYELVQNCTFQWDAIGETKGMRFTSKINGNSIFLPAGGDRGFGMNSQTEQLHWSNEQGYYWTSTLSVPRSQLPTPPSSMVQESDYAYMLYWAAPSDKYPNGLNPTPFTAKRFGGRLIRPVHD